MHIDEPLDVDDLLDKLGISPGGRVQVAVDKACIEWSMLYCPWRTGELAESPYTASEIGSGLITYDKSYARKMYYGEEDGEPVTYYSTAVNALAGPFWFDRAKADHLEDIVDAAQRSLDGRR